jgi:hypothetical protein
MMMMVSFSNIDKPEAEVVERVVVKEHQPENKDKTDDETIDDEIIIEPEP